MTPDEALTLATEAKRLADEMLKTYGERPVYILAKQNQQLAAAVEGLVEENRRLTDQRNWAMALSYACQEFLAGSITRESLDETIKALTRDAEEPPCK